jgi:hypothetical protein
MIRNKHLNFKSLVCFEGILLVFHPVASCLFCLAEAAYLSFWKVEIPQLLKLSAHSLSKAKFPASWQQARIQPKLGK